MSDERTSFSWCHVSTSENYDTTQSYDCIARRTSPLGWPSSLQTEIRNIGNRHARPHERLTPVAIPKQIHASRDRLKKDHADHKNIPCFHAAHSTASNQKNFTELR